jgi:hypothetical protein
MRAPEEVDGVRERTEKLIDLVVGRVQIRARPVEGGDAEPPVERLGAVVTDSAPRSIDRPEQSDVVRMYPGDTPKLAVPTCPS